MNANRFPRAAKFLWRFGIYYGFVIAVAWGLKWHYSRAGSSELDWILRPTAAVVALVDGGEWIQERGAGYHNRQQMATIAPACAGVNFMISAWCMLAVLALQRRHSMRGRIAGLVVSLAAAYLLTIAANSIRIVLSLHLYRMDIYTGWITPARVHRTAGVVVYLGALCLAFLCTSRKHASYQRDSGRLPPLPYCKSLPGRGLVPLFWYFAIALGVPLVNRAYSHHPGQFVEHAAFLAATGLLVFTAMFLLPCGLKSALKRLPAVTFKRETHHASQNIDH